MKDEEFESKFWGNCCNTFGEETKQLIYAKLMGIHFFHGGRADGPYAIDMTGKSIIDIGGGPVSLLLKCRGLRVGTIIDPLVWPKWVYDRYEDAGLVCFPMKGEQATLQSFGGYDECWIYNVLQHVEDPELVVKNARALATVVRLFEWVNLPPHPGHPHQLSASMLDRWLGGPGGSAYLNEAGCTGHAYFGVWRGTSL